MYDYEVYQRMHTCGSVWLFLYLFIIAYVGGTSFLSGFL